MPRAVTASALRSEASTKCPARRPCSCARSRALRVKRSLSAAITSIATAPPSATAPSSGWKSQMSATKIGSHGASNSASTAAPTKKPRSVPTSRRPAACAAPPLRLSCASSASSTRGPSLRSSATPQPSRRRARTASSSAIIASATAAASVSITSVSSLRLEITRSKSCSM